MYSALGNHSSCDCVYGWFLDKRSVLCYGHISYTVEYKHVVKRVHSCSNGRQIGRHKMLSRRPRHQNVLTMDCTVHTAILHRSIFYPFTVKSADRGLAGSTSTLDLGTFKCVMPSRWSWYKLGGSSELPTAVLQFCSSVPG